MNEAAITIVGRMQDDISPKMKSLAANTQKAQIESIQATVAFSAFGSALSGIGGVLSQLDNSMTKTTGRFLSIAGAASSTMSAIGAAIPVIRQMTGALRNMAIMQGVVQALSGPAGWITLGAGAAIGAGAMYGISQANRPKPSGVTINNYVQGSVVTEQQLANNVRRSIIQTQGRNVTSGVQ